MIQVGEKVSLENKLDHIFVGRNGLGFVFCLDKNALVNRGDLRSVASCISVEQADNDWVAVDARPIPEAVIWMAKDRLAEMRESYLAMSRKRCKTNSSYEAANSRGVQVRIWNEGGKFVCDVHDWSRWEGDCSTRNDEASFDNLGDAREWAEKRCSTRPSFGDVEWF
jgi:hypothetical protein